MTVGTLQQIKKVPKWYPNYVCNFFLFVSTKRWVSYRKGEDNRTFIILCMCVTLFHKSVVDL